MKLNPNAGRGSQRCIGCGHPRKEHLGPDECTVPKCACRDYQQSNKR